MIKLQVNNKLPLYMVCTSVDVCVYLQQGGGGGGGMRHVKGKPKSNDPPPSPKEKDRKQVGNDPKKETVPSEIKNNNTAGYLFTICEY